MDQGSPLRRKTCKRWDTPFDAHCLTFSCFGRNPFFRSTRLCQLFAQAIINSQLKRPFDLWAYVIMPEHVHLVIWPHEGSKVSAILQSMKLSLTKKAIHWAQHNSPQLLSLMADERPNGNTTRRFWLRGGGYDRNLRSDHDIHEKVKYVHLNPVRRGLATCPEDWPWSSARAYRDGVDGPIPLNLQSMPPLIS